MLRKKLVTLGIVGLLATTLGACSSDNPTIENTGSLRPITGVLEEQSLQSDNGGTDRQKPIGIVATRKPNKVFDEPMGIPIGTIEQGNYSLYCKYQNWAQVNTSAGYGWINLASGSNLVDIYKGSNYALCKN